MTTESAWDPRNNIDDRREVGEYWGQTLFTVRHFKGIPGFWRKDNGEYHRYRDDVHESWGVYLPHQCDDWDVAEWDSSEGGDGHAAVIAQLEKFIDAAQQALAALRDMR